MEIKEDKTLLVKSNNLVEASYRLTSVEQKIILTLVARIKKDDKEFQRYRFKISEFLVLMGIKDQSKYKKIPEIAEGLMKKILTIQEGKNTLKVAWLSGVKILRGEGIVEMEFSPYLKPYLLQLKERFTSYKLQDVIQLKSAYSVRIYELLKQYENLAQRTFKLDELRYILSIQENEYKLYHQFKQRIIQPSYKEIREKTDIAFEFEEIKENRKVTGIKFYIKQNNAKKAIDEVAIASKEIETDPRQDLKLIKQVQAILKEGITDLQAKEICDVAKGDINIIKEKYEIAKVTPKINTIVGWMVKAIKKDYQVAKGNGKVDSFNDYPQRNYDFVDLEKKLLRWNDRTDEATEEDSQQLSMNSEQ